LEDAGDDSATPGRRRQRDLTSGPIGRTLILFSLPVLGSNILQSLNGSANAFWVSHNLGETGLTATANANQIFFLMLGAVFGVTIAANIMIGQAIGARDEPLAKRVVGTCTAFFIVVSLAVGVIGGILTPHILSAMGTPGDSRAEAISYLRVIFAALPFMYFFSFMMMAQRGTGDSRTPFYFALLQVGLDVIFNPLLIAGIGPFPRLGIAGAATSTLVSQTFTLAMMLIHLYRQRSILVLRPSELRLLVPDPKILKTLVFKGFPMGLQMMIVSLAGVTMMSLVNSYGPVTAAAYGAASQLWGYVQMPAMALGAGVSAMAAQNIGAGRMDRVEKVAWVGAAYGLVFTLTPVTALVLGDPIVLRLFLPAQSAAMPIAQHINAIVLWGFVFFGLAFVFNGVVRATGAVWPTLIAMAFSLWVVRVPLAVMLMPRWGANAIWIAFPVASATTLVLAIAYYRWGGWRKARMIESVHGEVADVGLVPPAGVEETEVQTAVEEALEHARPLALEKPRSEEPAE
jgi:putative MATE family efflux protein